MTKKNLFKLSTDANDALWTISVNIMFKILVAHKHLFPFRMQMQMQPQQIQP